MLEKLPDAVGRVLRDMRAGLTKTMHRSIDLGPGTGAITLGSLAFADYAPIPARCTADGAGVSPPLHWGGVPPQAATLLLVVEDADSPTPQPWIHAIVLNLPADPSGALAEGRLSDTPAVDVAFGLNSLLQPAWLPPDPPPGHGVHRYVFQLFALEPGEPLPASPGRDAVRTAIAERCLASGCLIGTYERPDGSVPLPNAAAAPLTPA